MARLSVKSSMKTQSIFQNRLCKTGTVQKKYLNIHIAADNIKQASTNAIFAKIVDKIKFISIDLIQQFMAIQVIFYLKILIFGCSSKNK